MELIRARFLEPSEKMPAPTQRRLMLGPDATWFVLDGGNRERVNGAWRRMLALLVKSHRAKSALSMWELFDAGWPGEKPQQDSAANRVYVALNRLRGAGLPIQRSDDGYRLDPRLAVHCA